MLISKEQEERVTEPNTVVVGKGKSSWWLLTCDTRAHMTCNDLSIAATLLLRHEERAEGEKKKKKHVLHFQGVEDIALAILQQDQSVELLNFKELDLLLAWHQTPKVTGAKNSDKLVQRQRQNIVASRNGPSLFAHSTTDDEERLNGLMQRVLKSKILTLDGRPC